MKQSQDMPTRLLSLCCPITELMLPIMAEEYLWRLIPRRKNQLWKLYLQHCTPEENSEARDIKYQEVCTVSEFPLLTRCVFISKRKCAETEECMCRNTQKAFP